MCGGIIPILSHGTFLLIKATPFVLYDGQSKHQVLGLLSTCGLQRWRSIKNILDAAKRSYCLLWLKRGEEWLSVYLDTKTVGGKQTQRNIANCTEPTPAEPVGVQDLFAEIEIRVAWWRKADAQEKMEKRQKSGQLDCEKCGLLDGGVVGDFGGGGFMQERREVKEHSI
ncbi:unnamed protein product [Pleuronectes platessa]|uniref:Uncharacterized protein n=1 Tax=Pleuronectes platessa TaxID=8262 RepID=A0A9N7Y6H8_PLEPL|nr:unnamed protein product [Pleuronectes platessa]